MLWCDWFGMGVTLSVLPWISSVALFFWHFSDMDALCSSCLTPPYGSMEGYLVYCVFLSNHTVVWRILSLLFFVRLRISQWQKKLGAWNFACVLAYYPDRSSPLWWTLARGESRGRRHYFPMNLYHTDIDRKVECINRAVVIYAYDGRWLLGVAGGSIA